MTKDRWDGKEIRKLRLQLGWSQAQLGHRLGLQLKYVQELEKGMSRVSAESLQQLNFLQMHLHRHTEATQKQPLADAQLQDGSLNQIPTEAVKIPSDE